MKNLLLVILVILIIVVLFETMKHNPSENFNNNEINLKQPNTRPIYNKKSDQLPTIPTINACRLRENELKTDYYIDKFLVNNPERCPLPQQTIKEFNRDFFKFRDYTHNNSSIALDSVDKITNMILDGELSQAKNNQNKKIKDIFDDLTVNNNLYTKKCVRIPYFDNALSDGDNTNFITGMYNTRDNWMYENESQLNGAQVANNLYPHDTADTHQFPAVFGKVYL